MNIKRFILIINLILVSFFIITCSRSKKQIKVSKNTSRTKSFFEDKELKMWQQELKKAPYKIKIHFKNPFIIPAFVSVSEPTVSIKLVGIVEKNGQRIALVEDNNNLGYFVKSGTKIGKIKILDIGKNYIVITQKIIDDYGELKTIKKVLFLEKE